MKVKCLKTANGNGSFSLEVDKIYEVDQQYSTSMYSTNTRNIVGTLGKAGYTLKNTQHTQYVYPYDLFEVVNENTITIDPSVNKLIDFFNAFYKLLPKDDWKSGNASFTKTSNKIGAVYENSDGTHYVLTNITLNANNIRQADYYIGCTLETKNNTLFAEGISHIGADRLNKKVADNFLDFVENIKKRNPELDAVKDVIAKLKEDLKTAEDKLKTIGG